ncbi:hypothetical protein [Nocardia cyriacigeorgica]|uniref:hypothetical protein n=1 Tax=Nocardia cyriacigeorgica TaxID=135487 RepID=UPI0024587F11|nr:hypothetical protein [Nocardia cyriacigeorgica]
MIRAEPGAGGGGRGPASRASAGLLTDDAGGHALEVGAYRTAAGTEMHERIWTIRAIEPHGEGRRIKLGPALP